MQLIFSNDYLELNADYRCLRAVQARTFRNDFLLTQKQNPKNIKTFGI